MITWIIIGVIVVVLLFVVVGAYNRLVKLDQTANQSFADIDVQLKQRQDLIPNLVETVKGYATQEREVLTQVTEARASATQVKVDASTITDPAAFEKYAQAQDQLSGVLGRLMMIQERYPDLKSNQNFMALQSQLEGTENRIAIARRDYNAAVQDYNTEIRTFPGALWAGTVHRWAKPMQTFAASASAQTAPNVNFGAPAAPSVAAPAAPAAPATTPAPAAANTR